MQWVRNLAVLIYLLWHPEEPRVCGDGQRRNRAEFGQLAGVGEAGQREWILAGLRTFRVLIMVEKTKDTSSTFKVFQADLVDHLGLATQELYTLLLEAMPNQ